MENETKDIIIKYLTENQVLQEQLKTNKQEIKNLLNLNFEAQQEQKVKNIDIFEVADQEIKEKVGITQED